MDPAERRFALWVASSHGLQHFLRRIFPPLIPIWVVAFDFPLALAGLLLGVQSLGSAAGQAPFGILADRYDRRYLLPTGLAFAAVCVGVFATLPYFGLIPTGGISFSLPTAIMLATMFGVGVGGSVLHPTGYPLISENVDESRKGRALGLFGSAAKLGDGTAPAIVGALLLAIAWEEIMFLLAALVFGYSLALFVVLARFETRPASAIDAATPDRAAPVPRPTDRRVFLYPILAIFAFFAIRMLAAGGVNVFIPEFITSEYGYSFTVAGLEVTPESTASFYYSALLITAGLVQLGTGRLVDRFDARKVIIGMLVVASGVLAAIATSTLSPIVLFVTLLLLGASMWALEPARDAVVSDITPAEREGRTFGYLWTGALIVGSTSPVLIGHLGDTVGLRTAFAVLAVATLASAVPIALLLSKRVYVDAAESSADAAAAQDD